MSKRQIEVQGTKDGTSFLGDGSASANPDDVPKRATAAQLANRKLKSIRPTARKQTPGLQSNLQSSLSQGGSFGQQQQTGPSFGFGSQQQNTPQQPNAFGFQQPQQPQQQNGGIFGGATTSFPPAQSATPGSAFVNSSFPAFGTTANGNSGFGFNPTPPTASNFNFSTGGPNPFATSNPAPAVNGSTSGGFAGSIFSLPPAQPTVTPAAEKAKPETSSSQTLASPFKFGATSTSSPPTSNLFSQTTAPSSNIFSQSSQSSAPTSNIFGQNNAPTTPFAAAPALENKAVSPDAMQTSPDYGSVKPFSPIASTSRSAGTSLFERITPAEPKPQDAQIPSVEATQTEKPSQPALGIFGQTPVASESANGGNPFARIARTPSPAKEPAPSPAEDPKPANPFASLQRPLAQPGQSTPSQATSQSSGLFTAKAAANPFSSLSKPVEPIPSPPKQSIPSAATPSQTPSFGLPPTSSASLVMPPKAFAPPKPSPLKQSTSLSTTPPSNNKQSFFPQPPTASEPTDVVRPDGTTDAITYHPETGAITGVDILKATLADMIKALGFGPPEDADELGREIWLQREKLRTLNVGYRDRINKSGVFTDWTELATWYVKIGTDICTKLKTARRKKAAEVEASSGPMNASVKRKADPEAEGQHEDSGSTAKKSKNSVQGSFQQKTTSQTSKSLEEVLRNGSAASTTHPTFTQPSASMFANTPASSNSLFSPTAPASAEESRPVETLAKNPFSFATSVPASKPAEPAANLFGPASKEPASNLFGSVSKEPASNLFGSVSKEPAPGLFRSAPKETTPNLFGSLSETPAPNSFSSVSKEPASNLFAPVSKEQVPNIFTPASKEPTTNPFASLSKAPAPNLFSPTSKQTTSNLFGAQSSTSILQEPVGEVKKSTPLFLPSATAPASQPEAPTFTLKPLPATAPSTNIQVPKFNIGSGTPNFIKQFGSNSQTADQIADEAMKKAMANELDSDDSDYEDQKKKFVTKYKEELRQKRAKLATDSLKAPAFQFTPTGSNASSDSEAPAKPVFTLPRPSSVSSSNGLFISRNNSPTPSTNGCTSVFDAPASKATPVNNIFGHLSGTDSGGDAGKDEEDTEESGGEQPTGALPVTAATNFMKSKEMNEQSEDDSIEENMRRKRPNLTSQVEKQVASGGPVAPKSKSLFDRVTLGADGKPEKEVRISETENANGESETPKKATLFGNSLLPSSSSLFQGNASLSGDQTFKHDSPIRFGTSAPPAFSFAASSPATGAGASPTIGTNLFGHLTATPSVLKAPESGTSGGPTSTPAFSFGPPSSSAPAPSFLSASGTPSAFPSGFNSPFVSRAVTPFSADETSGTDTKGKKDDEDKLTDAQIRLTDLTETEKEEHDLLFECEKAKAMEHDTTSKSPQGSWTSKGIGPVRILKNKQTGIVSLLMRAMPGGKIIVNTRLLPKFDATGAGKTIRVSIATGPKPSSWCFRFTTDEAATDFMRTYNENRPT